MDTKQKITYLNKFATQQQVIISYSKIVRDSIGMYQYETVYPPKLPILKEKFLISWSLSDNPQYCNWCYQKLQKQNISIKCRLESCPDLFCCDECEEEYFQNFGYVHCSAYNRKYAEKLRNNFIGQNYDGITVFKMYAYIYSSVFNLLLEKNDVQLCVNKVMVDINALRGSAHEEKPPFSTTKLLNAMQKLFCDPKQLFFNLYGSKYTTLDFKPLEQLLTKAYLIKICNIVRLNKLKIRKNVFGVFRLFSTLNHSCVPNCSILFEDRMAQLFLSDNIEEDQELLVNYYEGQELSFKERKERLITQYNFQCQCIKCLHQE